MPEGRGRPGVARAAAVPTPVRRRSTAEGLRFLLAGGLNSAATYLLYLALLLAMPYGWAYTLSYAAGILLSFVANSWFVFRVPLDWRRLVPYPIVYAVQYGLGLVLLWAGVELFQVRPELMSLLVIALTVPVTFLLTRWVLGAGEGGEPGGPVKGPPGAEDQS